MKSPASAGLESRIPERGVSHAVCSVYRSRVVATQSLPLSGAPGEKIGPSATSVPVTPGETAVNFSLLD